MNPVVILVNALKSEKLVYLHSKQFRIKGEILGKKKSIETGTASLVELADYIVKNDITVKLIIPTKTQFFSNRIVNAKIETNSIPIIIGIGVIPSL